MNVTDECLRDYINAFHRSLEATAAKFLPPEHRSELFHASLLPARIKGYVSTQFGVAIEYDRASSTSIEILRGSARVEDLFVQAPSQMREIGPGLIIAGPGFKTADLTLSGVFPFRLAKASASVSFKDVGFRDRLLEAHSSIRRCFWKS